MDKTAQLGRHAIVKLSREQQGLHSELGVVVDAAADTFVGMDSGSRLADGGPRQKRSRSLTAAFGSSAARALSASPRPVPPG